MNKNKLFKITTLNYIEFAVSPSFEKIANKFEHALSIERIENDVTIIH